MISEIFSALRAEVALGNSKEINWACSLIVELLGPKYAADVQAANNALDAICAYLQSAKTVVVAPITAEPVAVPVVPPVES